MSARPDLAIVFPRASVRGGVERVALDLLRFESARRHACFVGHELDGGAGLEHIVVDRSRLPRSLRPAAFRAAAARRIRQIQPRVTLSFGANCPPGDIYWVQSVHAAWLENGGEVLVRGWTVPSQLRRLLLRHQILLGLERSYFSSSRPRAILCTSQREIDDLSRIYDVPREIMHLAPNGFDGRVFNATNSDSTRSKMRHTLGVDADDIVVLMVANEWHRKGLGVLLEAVSKVADARIRIDLVGAKSPDDYVPLATKLGLRERVHWHGPTSDVASFYAAADIFALPTTYEPFGLVIIEAMASGRPVVVPNLAGAASAITDDVNGLLLADPSDPNELRAALQRLMEPSERVRIGRTAAETVSDYEWNQVFERVDRIIFPA